MKPRKEQMLSIRRYCDGEIEVRGYTAEEKRMMREYGREKHEKNNNDRSQKTQR